MTAFLLQLLARPCDEPQRSGRWVRRTAKREHAVARVAKRHQGAHLRIEEERWLANRWMCT